MSHSWMDLPYSHSMRCTRAQIYSNKGCGCVRSQDTAFLRIPLAMSKASWLSSRENPIDINFCNFTCKKLIYECDFTFEPHPTLLTFALKVRHSVSATTLWEAITGLIGLASPSILCFFSLLWVRALCLGNFAATLKILSEPLILCTLLPANTVERSSLWVQNILNHAHLETERHPVLWSESLIHECEVLGWTVVVKE